MDVVPVGPDAGAVVGHDAIPAKDHAVRAHELDAPRFPGGIETGGIVVRDDVSLDQVVVAEADHDSVLTVLDDPVPADRGGVLHADAVIQAHGVPYHAPTRSPVDLSEPRLVRK